VFTRSTQLPDILRVAEYHPPGQARAVSIMSRRLREEPSTWRVRRLETAATAAPADGIVRPAASSLPIRAWHLAVAFVTSGWRIAKAHNLNPWLFVVMSAVGWIVQSLVYMPWFQSDAWRLALLILLRVVALVVPAYILLKGKRLALAFNASLVVFFFANTTWHVCYYVFL
jgi:hypothetical protein